MTIRQNVELADVLQAVVDRLQQQLGLSDATCYLCLDRDAPAPSPSGDWFITVSPDGGNFDGTGGGGNQQIMTDTACAVTIHSTMRLDDARKEAKILSNRSAGILRVMTRVMRALGSFDLVVDGENCLREWVPPQGFHKPVRNEDGSLCSLPMIFGLSFDWNVA